VLNNFKYCVDSRPHHIPHRRSAQIVKQFPLEPHLFTGFPPRGLGHMLKALTSEMTGYVLPFVVFQDNLFKAGIHDAKS
jgi:hypothetical protein